jgi:TonB family protein
MNHLTIRRGITALACLTCLSALSISVKAQGQQQQSPPIWDREGISASREQDKNKKVSADDRAGRELSWERYSSSDEEFSARLPEPPLMISQSMSYKPSEQHKRGRLYSAYGDGTVYLILSFDNPKQEEALDVFIKKLQGGPIYLATNSFERDINLNGFKGKQYRSQSPVLSNITQVYFTTNHVYAFKVVSKDLSKPAIKQFLESLTLDGKSKGSNLPADSMYMSYPEIPAPTVASSEHEVGQESGQKDVVFKAKDVTRKGFIVSKPPPEYTEEARQQGISGTAVLRVVLSSTGKVTDVRVVTKLPYGLTQRAIAAVRNLRFIPAQKDGKDVSQYVQIEYNFNLF